MLAHEHLQVRAWELGCFVLPFQVQNVCVHFPHVLISKPIYMEYEILLNFPSNKQTNKTEKPRAWKNIGKQKQVQRLLIIVLGFITERPQRGCHWESDPAWPSGELKCCCGYINIVNDFLNEWRDILKWESVCANVGCVQCYFIRCLLPFELAEPRQRVQGGDLNL